MVGEGVYPPLPEIHILPSALKYSPRRQHDLKEIMQTDNYTNKCEETLNTSSRCRYCSFCHEDYL